LARLQGFRVTLDAHDDLRAQVERVKQKWRRLNPLVFDTELKMDGDFSKHVGRVLPDAIDLKSRVEAVEALSGPAKDRRGDLELLELLRQQVRCGLQNRAWEGVVFACISVASGQVVASG
jgi:hypothetical protein